jgi:adenosine kinase
LFKTWRRPWAKKQGEALDILLTGSVAFDYLMSFPGYFQDHILPDRLDSISLSFLVESLVRRRGGTAPNIAYTLALLGGTPRLFATVGEDFLEYRRWLDEIGVDTSQVRVIEGEYTASFFANTDRSNAQIASFYPGAMAYAAEMSLHEIAGRQPDLAVVSPNDPAAMKRMVAECQELEIPYVYDPSQQIVRLDGDTLRRGVEGAMALFLNDYELALIRKKTGMTTAEICRQVDLLVVTHGEQGAQINAGSEEIHVPVVPPDTVADPTGVGDAFRAGFLVGYNHNWPWELCGQVGVLAATYCLENHGSQSHSYSRHEFVSRFRQHFNDHGRLDVLLPG